MADGNATAALAEEFGRLGVRCGGVLLVHSSLRSLGHVPGGAATVIAALLAAIGEEGTLLLPALTYASVGRHQPRFDVRSTPVCVGLIPETFRTQVGTQRSLHPTHSLCARGPRARQLLANHHEDRTPVGPHSPFRLAALAGGQLLMLGCGLRPNTSMHGVEEVAGVPYVLHHEPVEYELTDADGAIHRAVHRVHGFGGETQRYERIEAHMPASALRVGMVRSATCHLVELPEMWERGLSALRNNPFVFVDSMGP
jgi:aminoglycoside 3-N-acetyltransferase